MIYVYLVQNVLQFAFFCKQEVHCSLKRSPCRFSSGSAIHLAHYRYAVKDHEKYARVHHIVFQIRQEGSQRTPQKHLKTLLVPNLSYSYAQMESGVQKLAGQLNREMSSPIYKCPEKRTTRKVVSKYLTTVNS